jgi:hypothetical protein
MAGKCRYCSQAYGDPVGHYYDCVGLASDPQARDDAVALAEDIELERGRIGRADARMQRWNHYHEAGLLGG